MTKGLTTRVEATHGPNTGSPFGWSASVWTMDSTLAVLAYVDLIGFRDSAHQDDRRLPLTPTLRAQVVQYPLRSSKS